MAEPTAAPTASVSLVTTYNSVLGQRGFQLAPHHLPICYGLDDLRIPKLMAIGPPGLGKSTLLGIGYPVHRLGKDPTTTVLGISAGEKLIGTFMAASMEIIDHSAHYKRLFPETRPDKGKGWSTERGLFVTGRPLGDQDASYFAAGLTSKALTGVHAREIVLDDLHDKDNSRTPEGRAQVKEAYYNTILGRADPRGARFILAGRRWAPDDIYGELIKTGDWVVMVLPAERPGQKILYWDVHVPYGLECVFTERYKPLPVAEQDMKARTVKYRVVYGADPTGAGFYWPSSKQKREEYNSVKRDAPRVAQAVYLGDPKANEEAVFEDGDFTQYVPPENLSLGLASPEVAEFIKRSQGKVVQAFDTAMGQNTSTSLTVGLTGLLVPCRSYHRGEDPLVMGPCDPHYDVYLLDMYADNIKFNDLVRVVKTQHAKWAAFPVLIEEKISGISLLQVLRASSVPIRPLKVAEGKIERAVNGVGGGAASVQGWARQGRVRYPAGAPWAEQWLERVMNFTGDRKGRGDEFDATVHLVTWAILQSTKGARLPTGTDGAVHPVAIPGDPVHARQREMLESIGGLQGTVSDPYEAAARNPFSGFCGAPCHHYGVHNNATWCMKRDRPTMALDGCEYWAAKGTVKETVDEWVV